MQHDLFESPAAVVGPVPLGKNSERIDFLGSFRIALRFDQLVIVLIGLLAFYAVVYCVGVEGGKRAARPSISLSPAVKTPIKFASTPEVLITYGAVEVSSTGPKPDLSNAKIRPAGSYTIQMATYKTQSAADKQIDKFIKRGHQAFVLADGSLRLVCLDGYASRQEAGKALQLLKTRGIVPHDAFVRSLPQ